MSQRFSVDVPPKNIPDPDERQSRCGGNAGSRKARDGINQRVFKGELNYFSFLSVA